MTSGSGKAGPFSRASLISSKGFFFHPWNPVKRSFPTLELHIGLCQFNKPRDSELTQPSRSRKSLTSQWLLDLLKVISYPLEYVFQISYLGLAESTPPDAYAISTTVQFSSMKSDPAYRGHTPDIKAQWQ